MATLPALLQQLSGLKAVLVCDQEGAVILRGGDIDDKVQRSLQRMAATFTQMNEQANKLGFGRNKHMVAFHESSVVLHASLSPLVLTMMADVDANVGIMVEALPHIAQMLEPMQHAIENI